MISAGYFSVSDTTLERLGYNKAKVFIAEMFNCGGRIGYYEFMQWQEWIEYNLS